MKRCFGKDLEYGYTTHLADLSAGLDSRMVNWVAKDMGYSDIINISYSQSATDEERFTQLLNAKLLNQYYHHSLDDASFICDIDDITEELYGLAYYCGITGGWQWLNLLRYDNIGCEHTGQLGDVVLGAFLGGNTRDINPDKYRNSKYLSLNKQTMDIDLSGYDSQEEFLLYTRGFQGALATHFIRNNYTYALSPFLDVDFLEYCCSIPYAVRANHYIYWKWIEKYYPEAASIPSSRKHIKNDAHAFALKVIAKSKAEIRKMCRRMGLEKNGYIRNHMNPFDLWYNENPRIYSFINNYYNDNINLLNGHQDLKGQCMSMFENGETLDKLMVISLLAGIRRWCS